MGKFYQSYGDGCRKWRASEVLQTDPSGRYSDRFSRFEDCDVPFWKSVFTGAAAVLEKNPNMYADLSGLIEGAF